MIAPIRMQIPVVSGIGRGSTLLSAFDDALRTTGVHNYNLIPLSSVIPPGVEVAPQERYCGRRDARGAPIDEHGHRLYVVKADIRSETSGEVVGAGIGWYQWDDNRGVFVEHESTGSAREEVQRELEARICHSLHDLLQGRDMPFDAHRVRSRLSLGVVEDRPTCALTLAVFRSEGWHDEGDRVIGS